MLWSVHWQVLDWVGARMASVGGLGEGGKNGNKVIAIVVVHGFAVKVFKKNRREMCFVQMLKLDWLLLDLVPDFVLTAGWLRRIGGSSTKCKIFDTKMFVLVFTIYLPLNVNQNSAAEAPKIEGEFSTRGC